MISIDTLNKLALNKLNDSKILLNANKFDTSLYLVGYSIELALKSKICKILKLNDGFPETKQEFQYYISDSNNDLGNEIKHLKQIKNHDLTKLLFYSGQEYKIKKDLFEEWNKIINYWNPELRYKIDIGDKNFNDEIINSVEKLLNLIFK